MRRHLSCFAVVATLCTLAFGVLPINAEPIPQDSLLVIAYPVADLPVYSAPHGEDAEFKPDLLTSLIKAEVDPESWEARGFVSVHHRTHSLVIRQTKANHQRIADLMSRFRTPDPREEVEIKPPKLKLSQQSQGSILPPDPVLEQLKQQPPRQLVNIPLDLELLTDQFVPRTTPRVWHFSNQPDLPTDRDYRFRGLKFHR